MLSALTQLLIFQLAGKMVARGASPPFPAGARHAVLFIALMLRQGRTRSCRRPARTCCNTCPCSSCQPAPGSCIQVADEWPAAALPAHQHGGHTGGDRTGDETLPAAPTAPGAPWMSPDISQIWVYLSASFPLLRADHHAARLPGGLQNSTCAQAVIPAGQPGVDRRGHAGAFLTATGTRYETTTSPAPSSCISCSARPPWHWPFRSTPSSRRVRAMLLPVLAGLLAGSPTLIVSAVLIGWLFGASQSCCCRSPPESVTTPSPWASPSASAASLADRRAGHRHPAFSAPWNLPGMCSTP